MAIQKIKGIVVRSREFSETSKLVSFITSGCGQIRVLAKGARRPESVFRGKLELFNQGLVIFYPSRFSDLHLLSQFDLLRSFPESGATLEKSAFFYYLADLVFSASFGIEQGRHLYDLLLHSLERGRDLNNIPQAQIWFELRFLQGSGVLPPPDYCSVCGRKHPDRLFFSSREGWLCPACRKTDPGSIEITPGITAAMTYILTGGIERAARLKLSSQQNEVLGAVSRSLVDTYLGKRLKSLRFFRRIIFPGGKNYSRGKS